MLFPIKQQQELAQILETSGKSFFQFYVLCGYISTKVMNV